MRTHVWIKVYDPSVRERFKQEWNQVILYTDGTNQRYRIFQMDLNNVTKWLLDQETMFNIECEEIK